MKNLFNNLIIPFFDFKSCDFKSISFKNTIVSKSWLDAMLLKSQELLKDKDISIEKIIVDETITQLIEYCNREIVNLSEICGGGWKIDKAFIYSLNAKSKGSRLSELPHHDSVGVRLKIFVGLDKVSDGKIFNRVYNIKPNLFSNYNCDFKDRNTWNKIIQSGDVQYDDLIVSQDVFGIFNTNYIHEGIVRGTGQRNLIVVEVSNRIKSKFVFGKIGSKL